LIIFISSLLFNIHPVSQKKRLNLDFNDRILRKSYFPAFTTLLETLFHIPVDVPATVPRAAIIAMTINDAISPYSIAVAPFWHLTMPRISSNILAPIAVLGCERISISHIFLNKNFQTSTQMKKNPTLLIVVAAALVRTDGAVLLQKRPEGRAMAGLWEFPGGKLEEDEAPVAALARELAEELNIMVMPSDLVPACFASAAIGDRPLLLLLYICDRWTGEPIAVESPELGWYSITDMRQLAMPSADLPLIDLLEKLL
jgi:8-oxo-dGTP diphosphatase